MYTTTIGVYPELQRQQRKGAVYAPARERNARPARPYTAVCGALKAV